MATKEDLVEKLIAPVVIDLTNNYEFIKELENNLRDRIKDIQTNGLGSHRDIKIRDASFDIEIENQDLYEMLRYVSDRLTMTWEDYYELAKAYYEHHRNLEIPFRFKTNDGCNYDENGIVGLGHWIRNQRTQYFNLSEKRQQLLKSIGFVLNAIEEQWKKMYELAKIYYNHYENLLIPNSFKTTNGYDFDENGVRLGAWVRSQREAFQGKGTTVLNESRIDLLKKIGMVFENIRTDQWMQYYNLAKIYYEHHGNLNIPFNFRTTNGYDFDEKGIALGEWITRQRQSYKGSNNSSLTDDRRILLESIGMIFDVHAKQWIDSYNLAKIYYEHHGNLRIPSSFKTINGYEFSETGITLGAWIYSQRKHYEKKELGKIPPNQIQLLEQIGMIWNIKKNKEEIDNVCTQYNIDKNKNKYILSHVSIQELQSKIEFLKSHNIPIVDENGLLIDIFSMSSSDMKEKYGISLEKIINEYYIKNQMRKGV